MEINTKVILKTEKYEDDKYNPRNLTGVVVDGYSKFHPILVKWSNGVKNGYYANQLETVI